MPYDDPRWMGGIGMIGTKAVYNAVMHCDLLLMLGTDYPYSEFLPRKGTVIQVDERARVGSRSAPVLITPEAEHHSDNRPAERRILPGPCSALI